MIVTRKLCPVCQQRLSVVSFNDSAATPDGLARACRACTNARRRQRDRTPVTPCQSEPNLATALRRGDLKHLRKRLRAGVQPHWSWICETMREGHLTLAEYLLEAGAERNVFTLAALGEVSGLKRRLLRVPDDAQLEVNMEPNSQRVTPLHVACSSNWRSHGQERMTAQVQVVEVLQAYDADLNAVAQYRGLAEATPLFCACWSSGNLALVRWLLDNGASATDRDLLAALGHFQRHGQGNDAIAEALLAWGLPVDGSVRGERTPLQACAHQGVHATVAWLLTHGANVNARGPGKRTAAHFAAERNTGPTTLAFLVEHGADLTARDANGHTPLDLAVLNEKPRLVAWIRKQLDKKRS